MTSHSHVILIGNACNKPELRYLPSGKPVASFALAVNKWYKDAEGNLKDKVSFFDVECFGITGEQLPEKLDKGDLTFVEGEIQQDRWEDKQGQKRSKVKVVARKCKFLRHPKGEGAPRTERSFGPSMTGAGDGSRSSAVGANAEIPF